MAKYQIDKPYLKEKIKSCGGIIVAFCYTQRTSISSKSVRWTGQKSVRESVPISSDDDLDTEDEPYFMIQRQFEFPDGGICHFESHNEELFEHCKAESASLSSNKLSLSYGKEQCRDIEIEFGLHGTDYQEL